MFLLFQMEEDIERWGSVRITLLPRCVLPSIIFQWASPSPTLYCVLITWLNAQQANRVRLQIFDHALVMIRRLPFPYPIPIVCNKDTPFYSEEPVLLNPPPSLWVFGPCSERKALSFFVVHSWLLPGMPYCCFCCGADPHRASRSSPAERRERWLKGLLTTWWEMFYKWQTRSRQSLKCRKKSCCRSRIISHCGTEINQRSLSPLSLSFLFW